MKKTLFFTPYIEHNGKRGKAALKKTGSGVYIIKEGANVVYIGFSASDVKKTLYRHFQKWIDKRHPETKRVQRIERVTYMNKNFKNENYRVKVVFCKNGKEAADLEHALIKKIKPRDNSVKLDLMDLMDFTNVVNNYNEAETLEKNNYIDLPF